MNNDEYFKKFWDNMEDVHKEWCHIYTRYESVGNIPRYVSHGLKAVYKLNPTFHIAMMPNYKVLKNKIDKRAEYDEYDQEEYAMKVKNIADKAIKDAQDSISEEK